jgi:acyl CoA:acetate/3-ketoacid CoA transferase beta subunit
VALNPGASLFDSVQYFEMAPRGSAGHGDPRRVRVLTDLALLRWDANRFALDAVAPGFTPEEVIALAEMDITVGATVRTIE